MENKKHDLLQILLSLLLVISCGLYLLSLSPPSFHIDSVHSSSFNFSLPGVENPFSIYSPSFSANLTATWHINFHTINPNNIFSTISYESLEVSVNYGNYKIASALTPPFCQYGKIHHASVIVKASSKSIDNLVLYEIARDKWVQGVVFFNVRASSRVHLGHWCRLREWLVKAISNHWESSEALYAKVIDAGRKSLRLRSIITEIVS